MVGYQALCLNIHYSLQIAIMGYMPHSRMPVNYPGILSSP